MLRNSYRLPSLLLITFFVLGTAAAQATVMYPDVSGTSVDFSAIAEGSPTGDPEPLYGAPIPNGDSLVFPTTASFSATSGSGGPADQTDGKLTYIITAKPGAYVTGVNMSESGVTTLNAPFGGDAFTSVIASADIKILEISGAPVVSPNQAYFFTFSTPNSFLHSADATGPSFNDNWAASLSVAMPANVTKLLVVVDNYLYAATVGVGTGAFIDKQGFDLDIDTVVPEPTTMLLSWLGISFIALRRRGSM
jgi:hypothetical protein